MESILEVVERLGVSVAVAGASMWFIWRQTQFMQKFFMEDIQESQNRLEQIIITLINKQKELEQKTLVELTDMRSSYESLVEIMHSLTSNGHKVIKRDD
tara:strand:- start:1594 stop:1890 length:297 start_codon:yes stop_codon:yes gene_type:complete